MVGPKRLGDLTVPVHPQTEAVDVTDRPVTVGFEDDIGHFCICIGCQRFTDDGSIALVQKPTVPVMRVDHRPILGIFDFVVP